MIVVRWTPGRLSSTTATKCQTPPVDSEIDLALTQLRAEMLHRVAAALSRLDEGHYGSCIECGGDIPGPRLKAMPFAIRCRNCELAREEAERLRSAVSRDRVLRTLS